MTWSADSFAEKEFRHYGIYHALAKAESDPRFKDILERFAKQEYEDFNAWRDLAERKTFSVPWYDIALAKFFRTIFGITYVARYLKRQEDAQLHEYERMLPDASQEFKTRIMTMIAHEREREAELIAEINEEKVEFTSSIILGLNDGLIELTGAITGFSFALQDPRMVALTGSITGIAAALSMAASAYMQASHDINGKDPKKSAFYTGVAYFIVVVLLVGPFLLFPTTKEALFIMAIIILCIISSISYYTAVIFERSFVRQFRQMFLFSIGVAAIAFLLGTALRKYTGLAE